MQSNAGDCWPRIRPIVRTQDGAQQVAIATRILKLLSGWLVMLGIWIYPTLPLYAQSSNEVIQEFTHGGINWTRGKIYATCEYTPEDDHFGQPVDSAQALQAARANLLAVVKSMRIDAHTRLANFYVDRGTILLQIDPMVNQATITHREYLSDGTLKIALEMNIWGGLAQLVLPPEIRSVEVIKPVGTSGAAIGGELDKGDRRAVARTETHHQAKPFTGLVLDARGLNIQPAMVPLIRDASNNVVYGPVFVSREFVVQQGMALYLRDITGIRAHPRVRFNPLIIKCLPREEGLADTDLMISDQDATLLRSSSDNLAFMRECRVIIVVD